jgi:uncharacterized protein DUF4242
VPETDRRLFLVEHDLRGLTSWQLDGVHRALGEAVRRENQRGRQIRYVQRIYAPAEQRCLCLFEAAGPDLVRSVNDIAQFPLARVLAVLSCVPEETGSALGLDDTGPRPDSDQAAAAGLRARGDVPLGDP